MLALTYEMEVEARGGADHLRTEPQSIVTEGAGSKGNNNRMGPTDLKGFYIPPSEVSGY